MTNKPFPSENEPEIAALLEEARKSLAKMRKTERKVGFGTPEAGPLDVHLRTALSALFCYLGTGERHILAEGIVMLQDAELRVRGLDIR